MVQIDFEGERKLVIIDTLLCHYNNCCNVLAFFLPVTQKHTHRQYNKLGNKAKTSMESSEYFQIIYIRNLRNVILLPVSLN